MLRAAEARPRTPASKIAAEAKSELVALTGKDAEGVTGLERTEDGWLVRVEVVELRRIPDTTDVLALYEVQTDAPRRPRELQARAPLRSWSP